MIRLGKTGWAPASRPASGVSPRTEWRRRLVSRLPALILAASLGVLASAGWRLADKATGNAVIAALAVGRDAPAPEGAPPEAVFARVCFLLARDRIDEAQPLVERLALAEAPAIEAAALYNMANARMRLAFALIEASAIDKALPQLRLAREDYRRALTLNPDIWDARYNLEFALLLVRDFPEIEARGDDAPLPPAGLWTDLPGLPKGLP